ncbi:MAG: histidine--tRNA ligase [Polyangiales bacterium]
MNDLLPGEIERWQLLEATIRRVVALHGYREIRTPIVEPTPLFVRSVGEGTDIVDKEMYSFVFHDEPLTLRPEGTAGVVRAYVEHGLHTKEPVSRLFYTGAMFRGERPARGRYRQFYQAGCEVFGDAGPVVDAEMIDMLVGLLREVGVEKVTVLLNSLGSGDVKLRYAVALQNHMSGFGDALSDDSKRRCWTNPLRILDSKSPKDAEAIATAPSILEFLSDEDKDHFEHVQALLVALGTPYVVEPRLVRGLDYYTRTLFELRGEGGELGAQNALGGGGRYDKLVSELGGPATPGIGFGLGLERILLAMPQNKIETTPSVFLAPMGERATRQSLTIARSLREAGVVTHLEGRGSKLGSMLKRASGLGARLAIIIGDTELEKREAVVRDLAQSLQVEVPFAELVSVVTAKLGRPAVQGAP